MKEYLKLGLLYKKTEGVKLKHTTDSSSGEVDFEQVLKGNEDIFFIESPEETLEKKKIIITDMFRFKQEVVNKIDSKKYLMFYTKLLNDGFKLYVYRDGNLKEINDLSILKYIKPATHKDIKNAAAKIGFGSNEIFISGLINSLPLVGEGKICFEVESLNRLPTFILHILYEEMYNKGKIKIALKLNNFIDYTKISNEFLSLFDELIVNPQFFDSDLWSKLTSVKKVKYITPSYYGKNIFFFNNIPQWLININISGEILDSELIENISSLDSSIIKKITINFTKITISNSDESLKLLSNILFNCQSFKVKSLLISFKYTKWTEFELLLTKIEDLEEISIYELTTLEISQEFRLPPSIKKLEINHSSISFAKLKQITQDSNLEYIYLEDIVFSEEISEFSLLGSVKEIVLKDTDISFKGLNLIVGGFKNLVTISLSYVKLIGEIQAFDSSCKVTKISLANMHISFSAVKELLHNCNNLNQLLLLSITGFADKVEQKKQELNSSSKINAYTKGWILYFKEKFLAENVEKIKEISDINLSQTIQEIDLSYSDVGPQVFKEITDQYLNLKKLTVVGCENLEKLPKEVAVPKSYEVTGLKNNFPVIDDRTESKDKKLKYTRYFKPKPEGPEIWVSDYRLKVYTSFDLNTGGFSHDTHPSDFIDVEVPLIKSLREVYQNKYEKKKSYFLGKKDIAYGSRRNALPSLDVNDELIGIEIIPPQTYSIVRCSKDDLYYLTTPHARSQTIVYFIIKSPYRQSSFFKELYNHFSRIEYPLSERLTKLKFTEEGKLNAERLYGLTEAQKIHALTDYFEGFENKELSYTPANPRETMNAVMEERAGVCRHGAQAFMAASLALGLNTRLVGNDIHQFDEIYSNKKWDHLDFGDVPDGISFEADNNGWSNEISNNPQLPSLLPQINGGEESKAFSWLTSITVLIGTIVFSLPLSLYGFYQIYKNIKNNKKLSLDDKLMPFTLLATFTISLEIISMIATKKNLIFSENNINKIKDIMSFINPFTGNVKPYFNTDTIAGNLIKEPKAIDDYSIKEKDIFNYNTMLIIIASAGSIALIGIAARYFYSRSQSKIANVAKPVLIDQERNSEAQDILEINENKKLEPKDTSILPSNDSEDETSDSEDENLIMVKGPDIPSENPFMPKQAKQIFARNMEEYVKSIVDQAENLDRKNILCVMEENQIEEFYSAMLHVVQDLYFISNLDEVSLKDAVINNGDITRVDSKLAKFLEGKGFLLVDWSNCKPQNIGFNSIVDLERRVETAIFPKDIVVISILKNGIRLGDDFYTRHKITNYLPKTFVTQSKLELPTIKELAPTITDSSKVEILFYDNDWQKQLFGRIKIGQEEGYFYKLSELHEYVRAGNLNIILRNAPWDDREFRLAIKDIEARGAIYTNGHEYKYEGIHFIRNDLPYSLEGLVELEFDAEEEYQVVNKASFKKLFEQYFIESKKLVVVEEMAKRKLLITENLYSGQWAKLAAVGAEILVGKAVDNSPFVASDLVMQNKQTKIIITNDLGLCKKDYADKLIIYINTETTYSELVEKLTYYKDSGTFEHRVSVVVDDLLAGKEVVLVGNLSKNLMSHLTSLFINKPYMMINGKRVEFLGKLTLITEGLLGLDMIAKEERIFSREDIWTQASKDYSDDLVAKLKGLCKALSQEISGIENFSYTQINSMLHRMELKPNSNPFKHLLRLRADYKKLKPILEKIWLAEDYGLSSIFDESSSRQINKPTRIEKVISEAEISPLLFIVGPSGAGKSTFMRKELSLKYEIYEGMKSLIKLTEASVSGKPRLLFLDEANLNMQPASYEIFNGIFEDSRQVLINLEMKKILEGNLIILVGNYGYFKGRKNIKIIQEHGSIISFKELADEIIKSKIVRPILLELFPTEPDSIDTIAEIFIKAYHHINNKFQDKELLTVRNIEMMCFRSRKLHDDGIKEIKLRTAMSIYDEVSVMLTKAERKEYRNWLEQSQGLEKDIIKIEKAILKNSLAIEGLFIAQSRKNIVRLLEYMTSIRELKIEHNNIEAPAIKAILFEGDSGSGKSYLATKFLEYLGFYNAAKFPTADNKYYVITPTNFMRAQENLIKLVDDGAVILVDEINTMPLEDVLNPLLSGVNLHGESAKKKGGLLIATQNPISYGNRITFSDALNKRFQIVIVKDMKRPELIEMLKSIIKDKAWESWIEAIVDYYIAAIEYTNKYGMPNQNLRQLTDYVDQIQSNFNIANEILDGANCWALVPYEQTKSLTYFVEHNFLKALKQSMNSILSVNIPQELARITVGKSSISTIASSDHMNTEIPTAINDIDYHNIPASEYTATNEVELTWMGNIFGFYTIAVRSYLLNYIYADKVIAINKILSKEYIKSSKIPGIKSILEKSPLEWSEQDFKKIYLVTHPDKQGDAEDFRLINEFKNNRGNHDDLDNNLYIKAFEKFIPSIQNFIIKATIGFKTLDIAIDGTKLACEPTIANAKATILDTTYLYSIYAGANGYSSIVNIADISYKLYQEEYIGAAQQVATIAAYMALSSVIAATGIPYIGLLYSSFILGYTGYNSISNAYSFYQEYGSDNFNMKYYEAYKNVAQTFSNTPLQTFYDFSAKAAEYKLALNMLKLEQKLASVLKYTDIEDIDIMAGIDIGILFGDMEF